MPISTLFELAEGHVPGLFRSRSQLRSIAELLRKQKKVMLPGGRYMCRSLYLVEKERRGREYAQRTAERAAEQKASLQRRF